MSQEEKFVNLGKKVIKILLIIFNGIQIIIGISLITIGSMCTTTWSQYFGNSGTYLYRIPYLIIGLGLILFVISVIGFVGAVFEHKILLMLHLVLVIVAVLFQMCAAIGCGVFKSQLKDMLTQGLNGMMSTNVTMMSGLQSSMSCCGVNGPGDYNATIIPSSCCPNSNCTTSTPYTQGCLSVFYSWSISDMGVAVVLTMVIVIVQAILIALSAKLYTEADPRIKGE